MREFWLRRVAPRLGTDRGLWLVVAACCAAVYATTAHWTFPGVDSEAAAWPAWSLAHRGTLNLAGLAGLPHNAWFVQAHGQLLSNRTIGVVLLGVPVNLALGWTGLSPVAAAALTAVLVTAAAVATVTVLMRSLFGLGYALCGAVVLAFGTAMWTVSSAELWTHTGDALWLALALLALRHRRLALAGLAFAPAILTRPHLALAALAIALWLSVSRRSLRPMVCLAVPAGMALCALAGLNAAIYGHWSLTGGYGYVGYSVAAKAAVGGGGPNPLWQVTSNVLGALVSPRCGLLLYSPVVLAAFLGVRRGFRSAPDWMLASAAGGCVYELAQSKLNGFDGGSLFFSNRLILETLLLCAPLLFWLIRAWVGASRPRLMIVATLATCSVAIHAIGAVLPVPNGGGVDVHPWRTWFLLATVQRAGMTGWIRVALIVLLGFAVLRLVFERASRADADAVFKLGAIPVARPESSDLPAGWVSEPVQPV